MLKYNDQKLIRSGPHTFLMNVILGILYLTAFAFSVSWIFSWIGTMATKPETVSGTSMVVIYPLLFASNILVEPATMPRWLQTAVELNPVSIAAALTRGLMHGTATGGDIVAGIGACVLLIVVFIPLSFHAYLKQKDG